MKIGRVLLMKEVDNLTIPDEFVVEMTGNDDNSTLVYIEYYKDKSEKHFKSVVEETKKDILSMKKDAEIETTYNDNVGAITIKQSGSRSELLLALFQEILLQLNFYYDNERIKEFFDYVKVYEFWEEK